MSSERWQIAIHEAGHAIAGVVLGGQCNGVVINAVGGLALVDDLHGDRHAFMVAAGPAAEYLADQHEAPQGELASYEETAATPVSNGAAKDFVTVCMFADVEHVPKSQKSDARHLAEWAIDGVENDPERWPRRIKLAKYVAERIVHEYREQVITLAGKLYLRGRIEADEILHITNQKTEVVS